MTKKGIIYLLRLNLQLFFLAVIFFIAAGRLDIPRAWLYFGIGLPTYLISSLILAKYAPILLNERTGAKEGIKIWDTILLSFYLFLFFAFYLLAGLDLGRFGWSTINPLAIIPGIIFYLASSIISVWAMVTNEFMEVGVRIQLDREQRVIKEGPYRYVRHPSYFAVILSFLSAPLILGSFYSFFMTVLIIIVMVTRTYLEDKALQEELTGYSEYVNEVKYRLIPFIW